MDQSEIRDTLMQVVHFQGLDEELLERVVDVCRAQRFASGEAIFRQGDACRGFFVIRTGGVRLFRLSSDGREQVVHLLHAGQSFAEAALFNLGRYPVHAVANEEPTELLELRGEPFLELFHGEPRLSSAMVSSLSQRLLFLVQRVEELAIVSGEVRLARYLLRLPARESEGRATVTLTASKREIAGLIAVAPETLSRILRRWRDSGLLDGEGRELVLLDVAGLERLIG